MDFPGRPYHTEDPVPPPPHALTIDISKSQPRMLYKVPEKTREKNEHIYWPVVVSLGPYHHRRKDSQLAMVEPLKHELRDALFIGADHKKSLLSKINARMGDIRKFYGGADGFPDEELADMMFRDACFLICFMHGYGKHGIKTYEQMCERLGRSLMMSVLGEMFMLENQIPLWLISLVYPEFHPLLREYLSYNFYGDHTMTELPWTEDEQEPLHLLEALHRTFSRLGGTNQNSTPDPPKKDNQPMASTTAWQRMNSPFRSVTHLKAKGIHFRPSSNCLKDINFASSGLSAKLQLPIYFVSKNSKVLFSNLIAFEMSSGTETDFGVTSYINFMKTLIDNANDVKLLREEGILYSMLESDKEVVSIFKSIDTFGFSKKGHFNKVKMKIDEHCNNKGRTWMADLENTKLRSPWPVIGLLAATLLLILTFLQTYYTINPRN